MMTCLPITSGRTSSARICTTLGFPPCVAYDPDYKVIRSDGQVVRFEGTAMVAVGRSYRDLGAPRRVRGFRVPRTRGVNFVGGMLRRQAASRLVSRCAEHAAYLTRIAFKAGVSPLARACRRYPPGLLSWS
jgi:hypothetical protein